MTQPLHPAATQQLELPCTEHLLCAMHCAKSFIHMTSFTIHSGTNIVPILQMRKLRHRELL